MFININLNFQPALLGYLTHYTIIIHSLARVTIKSISDARTAPVLHWPATTSVAESSYFKFATNYSKGGELHHTVPGIAYFKIAPHFSNLPPITSIAGCASRYFCVGGAHCQISCQFQQWWSWHMVPVNWNFLYSHWSELWRRGVTNVLSSVDIVVTVRVWLPLGTWKCEVLFWGCSEGCSLGIVSVTLYFAVRCGVVKLVMEEWCGNSGWW